MSLYTDSKSGSAYFLMSESLILSCEFCIQFVNKLIIFLPDLDQSIFTCPRASILSCEFCIQFVTKLLIDRQDSFLYMFTFYCNMFTLVSLHIFLHVFGCVCVFACFIDSNNASSIFLSLRCVSFFSHVLTCACLFLCLCVNNKLYNSPQIAIWRLHFKGPHSLF